MLAESLLSAHRGLADERCGRRRNITGTIVGRCAEEDTIQRYSQLGIQPSQTHTETAGELYFTL